MKAELINERILFLSIKPKYVEKILSGEKTVELRKALPNKVKKGNLIFIYSTAPEMELKGFCEIEEMTNTTPSDLWDHVNEIAGISKEEYQNYYHSTDKAVAIYIKNIERLMNPIKLSEIKKVFPNFSPPQTFKYLNSEDIESMKEKDLWRFMCNTH